MMEYDDPENCIQVRDAIVRMSALLTAIEHTRDQRDQAEHEFRQALAAASPAHPWREIARTAGMSVAGVRYLALSVRDEPTREEQ